MAVSRRDSPWLAGALWAIAAGTTTLTVWFSLASAPPGVGSDKALHAVAYLVNTLAILLAAAWRPGNRVVASYGWTAVTAFAMLLLGAALEVVQGYFGRTTDWRDWAADATGITVAVLAFAALAVVAHRPRSTNAR